MQPQQYAPPMPQYPQAPGYPAQSPQAYPPQQPAYPQPGFPQGYAQPVYAPPPPPVLPQGTLDGFFEQPSGGGGPSFKFNNKPVGTSYAGIVARPITDSDVRAQTNQAGEAVKYKDGRPKFVMVVPMQVQPSPEFPDGVAGWWVKGQARDELARAMAEAGAPAGPPEAGAAIRVTLVGQRQIPGMNPAFQYRVDYMRPAGAAPVPPRPVAQAPDFALPAPQPVQEYAPVVSTAMGQPVVHQQPIQAPPVQQLPMPQPVMQQPAPIAAPTAAPAGFSPEQAELFARLTGGSAAPAA